MKKQSDDDYGHVLKYTGIFGGVQGLNIMIGLVRNKCVALLLGANGLGFASLMNSVQGFVSQATNLGIAFSAVPRLSEVYEEGDEQAIEHHIKVIRLWSFIAALLGLVVGVSISPFIDKFTFTWGHHTLHYVVLAPSVAMMAVSAGETAILKATRRLGALVRIQLKVAVASLLISVPLYYFFFHSAVVPVMVLMALTTMLVTIGYSYRIYPLRLSFSRQSFAAGYGIIRLGVAFVLAAVAGQAAEVYIRSYLNASSMNDVGFYNAGYVMTIYYASIVFSSVESDFYPRLSAVCADVTQANLAINRQVEVLVLLISPILTVLMVFLPVLIPLLYSQEFLPVITMGQVAIIAMYFKAVSLPVAYLPLAHKDSLAFLLLDCSYFVYFVLFVIYGYQHWGVLGTGYALTAAHLIELVVVLSFAYFRYGYRWSAPLVRYAVVQTLLGLATYAVTLCLTGLAYWLAGVVMMALSGCFSLVVLHRKTSLWAALMGKLSRRLNR